MYTQNRACCGWTRTTEHTCSSAPRRPQPLAGRLQVVFQMGPEFPTKQLLQSCADGSIFKWPRFCRLVPDALPWSCTFHSRLWVPNQNEFTPRWRPAQVHAFHNASLLASFTNRFTAADGRGCWLRHAELQPEASC